MSTNDIKMEWTRINEKDRVRMGISRDEYALCRYVEYRGKDVRQSSAGWCKDSKSEIADFVGVSRRHLYRAIEKMEAKGLLKLSWKGDLSTTKLWADGGVKCDIMLHFVARRTVTLCLTNCDIMLHFAPFKCNILSHTPYKRDSKLEKLEIECVLTGTATLAKVIDPSLPGVEIHELIKTPKQRPTPGPAKSVTSLGAAKQTPSEVAGFSFEEFWEAYGFKRGSKVNAKVKWNRLDAAEITAIRATLEIYKRETVTEDGQRGDKFKALRKYPEFFLSAKTWEAFAEQAKEEAARPKDEWDDQYQTYVEWVQRKYPTIAKAAAYLTKQQYVCHKTEWYVKGMSYIGDHNIQNMLIRAHDALESGVPKASQCGSVFNYQVHLLEERVKSRTV